MPPALVGRAATMQMGPSQPKIARSRGEKHSGVMTGRPFCQCITPEEIRVFHGWPY